MRQYKPKTDHGRNLSGADMVLLLDEWVNGAGSEEITAFVDALVNRTHRTLQQKICTVMVKSIEAWASLSPARYDGRNEATVKLCKRIVEATGDKYDRHLPTI